VKLIIPAGLLCFSCTLLFGQQQTPAEQPQTPAPAQTPTPTPTPVVTASSPASTAAPADVNKDVIDGVGSITLLYWLSAGSPRLVGGKQSLADTPGGGNLGLPGDDRHAPGIMIAIPAGKFNRLEVSYFQANGAGNSTAPQTLNLFGQAVPSDDYLAMNYRIRNYKVSWNYLTWPSPPENAKFRIKTLWEMQYTTIGASIDAPFETSASFSPAMGSKHIIFPTFGLGPEWVPSKYFRIESRGSAFGFPHKAEQWEAEANAVGRVGRFELFVGAKIFHFKTSPNADNYIEGTLKGPYAGLRLVFR
jgi:hypothetical protein